MTLRITPLGLGLVLAPLAAAGETSLTQHGITWTFAGDHECGQYVNGDHWVVGPVTVVSITNDAHVHGFEPESGNDGSMVNPEPNELQGYDFRLRTYEESLNAALPSGAPVSAENPLALAPNSSLVSSVSWLSRSDEDKEPDAPRYNKGTNAPRPVLRDAAILTVVERPPAAGSFRPPYCGSHKASTHTVARIRRELIPSLKRRGTAARQRFPDLYTTVERPWIDHGFEYLGGMIHPSGNMPQYGRDVSLAVGNAAVALCLDWDGLDLEDEKEKLLIGFLQVGIDLAGIIREGGSFPSNGGHHMGRKYPILYAGLMLDDRELTELAQREGLFQEDLDAFYVDEAAIAMTASPAWNPGRRSPRKAYDPSMLGVPEWGIRHTAKPNEDNAHWEAIYRMTNSVSLPGWILAAHIHGLKPAWGHDPLFDYVDRAVAVYSADEALSYGRFEDAVFGTRMIGQAWSAYRDKFGPRWTPDDPSDPYSPGRLVGQVRSSGEDKHLGH